MKIVLTGGLGYLGCEVARCIHYCLDAHLLIIDRNRKKVSWQDFLPKEIAVLETDIRCLEGRVLNDTDVLIHLAALASPTSNAASLAENNIEGTERLRDLALQQGVRFFLFASTAAIYGETSSPATEESPLAPASPYAASKRAGEQLLLSKKSASFVPIVFRLATLYGYSASLRWDLPVHKMIRDACESGEIVLSSKEDITRPCLSLADALRAILVVLKKPPVKAAVWNLGRENCKLAAIARMIQDCLPVRLIQKDGSSTNYAIATDRFESAYNFQYKHCLKEQIPLLIRQLQQALHCIPSSSLLQ